MSNTTLSALQATQNQNESRLPAVIPGFGSLQSFELIQRVAKGLASSELVPKSYQGNIASCMIALDMAQRIGAAPLMVMQNLYIVHGNPGWSSKFLIATVNACGRYTSLRYEWKGQPGTKEYGCRAWSIERETGERLDGIWVTWEMVRNENWDTKNGSKWKTMPDQMFVYRAAAFWQRAYAPELAMGLSTADELEDIFDAKQQPDGSFAVNLDELRKAQGSEKQQASVVESIDQATGEVQNPAQAPVETAKSSNSDLTAEEKAAISAKERAEAEAAEQGQAEEPATRGTRTARPRTQSNIE